MEDGLVLRKGRTSCNASKRVLLLVVVEEGLVRTEVICTSGKCFVLILVVVEDGIVHARGVLDTKLLAVLILVVMEDGLVP